MRREIEARRCENRRFWERHAFEPELERLAHGAARAVGADEPRTLELLPLAAALDGQRDCTLGLAKVHCACIEPELARELRDEHARELPLLALHAIGMARMLVQDREIEFGALAGRVHAHLPRRCDQSLANDA